METNGIRALRAEIAKIIREEFMLERGLAFNEKTLTPRSDGSGLPHHAPVTTNLPHPNRKSRFGKKGKQKAKSKTVSESHDPKSVMSDRAWEMAMGAGLKPFRWRRPDGSIDADDPVYFVVREEGGNVVAVIDEKMDSWFEGDMSAQEKEYYLTEVFPKDEIEYLDI